MSARAARAQRIENETEKMKNARYTTTPPDATNPKAPTAWRKVESSARTALKKVLIASISKIPQKVERTALIGDNKSAGSTQTHNAIIVAMTVNQMFISAMKMLQFCRTDNHCPSFVRVYTNRQVTVQISTK